jgi:hypothetical protein
MPAPLPDLIPQEIGPVKDFIPRAWSHKHAGKIEPKCSRGGKERKSKCLKTVVRRVAIS